jgi:hypothetical protein
MSILLVRAKGSNTLVRASFTFPVKMTHLALQRSDAMGRRGQVSGMLRSRMLRF